MFCFNRQDPFSKKEWYMIKAPSTFSKRDVGHTLVTKTIGTKVGMEWIDDFGMCRRGRASIKNYCGYQMKIATREFAHVRALNFA